MSDLIERQDAIDAMIMLGIKKVVSILVTLPSTEPERKKETWEVQPSTGEDRPFIWWKCSECGHVIFPKRNVTEENFMRSAVDAVRR